MGPKAVLPEGCTVRGDLPMARSPQPPISEEVPLYVRWSPDRSAYSIELRLDLVPKIAAQVSLSEQLGAELGGFLLGSFPSANVPTIRIDDIEMVSNGSDDETVFLPDPTEYRRFPEVRGRARARESSVIGFFRTHARTGPMRPSPADRSILAPQFGNSPYVVLLIQVTGRHTGVFFVSANGQLPQEPSVREFDFSENEFKALPEVQPDAETDEPLKAGRRKGKLRTYATVAALLFIAVGACALMWSFARQVTSPHWFGSTNQIQLAVRPEDRLSHSSLLRITWDHAARELNKATGATLVINDGGTRSELPLGVDDLRLGAVEYQRSSSSIDVQMTLNTPNGPVLGDSAQWAAQ
jgi:hypothetical protein